MSPLIIPDNENESGLLAKVHELRQRLPDIVEVDGNFQEPFYLMYFLKAKNFNVDKAEAFIREVVRWRVENNSEFAAKNDYHPDLEKSFRVYQDGRTRDGMVAWTAQAGLFRFKEIIAKYGKDGVHNYWHQLLAKFESPNIVLLDMAGMSYLEMLSRDVLAALLDIARMAVSHFPAVAGVLCFVNAGKVLELFFTLLKPLLKGTNVELVIFDYNQEKWSEYVRQLVDPSQLRTTFGGTIPHD